MLRGVCCWGSPRVPPGTRSIACRTVAVLTWAALTYGGADLSEAILVCLYNNAERCGLTGGGSDRGQSERCGPNGAQSWSTRI